MATPLRLCLLAAMVAGALSCAFPPQGCTQQVCDRLDATKFNDLLNANTFDVNDKRKLGDWSTVPDLGYFYGVYNPLFNGGKYDAKLKALKDKAPSVNYFEWRSDRGNYAPDASTMSECCNACRVTPGCHVYVFDPYIERDDDDSPTERNFAADGQGDCWLLFNTDKVTTLDKINGQCTNWTSEDTKSDMDFYNPTVKSTFYGGLCNVEAKDDPHFVGARGTHFDFNGELDKSFCLLTDSRVQLNALLRGYVDPRADKGIRSWMKELGFVWLDDADQVHTLRLVARAGAQRERGTGFMTRVVLDGEEAPVPQEQAPVLEHAGLTLTFLGVRKHGPYELDDFRLTIGTDLDVSLSLRVAHALLQTPEDAEVHFNLLFHRVQASEKVHGVLGQTYRQSVTQLTRAIEYSLLSRILGGPVQADGDSGKGFLDGEVQDYVTSSVVSSDCKFSALGA